MSPVIPSYRELRAATPPGSSWSVWGPDFSLGSLNHLSRGRALAAAQSVRTGQTYSLNLAFDEIDPPLFGRSAGVHRLTNGYDAPFHDDLIDGFNTQSSSQWDGLRHARHPVYGWYGGVPEEQHGVQHWAARTITGRGVLVDIDRWQRARGSDYTPGESYPITTADIDAALRAQAVTLEPGDILCVRTGWLRWYRDLDPAQRSVVHGSVRAVGLAPGHETLAWLWDNQLAAVAADNPAVEAYPFGSTLPADLVAELQADPTRADELNLHQAAIPLLGLVLGELFDLDALAADCARDDRWVFLFTAAPMGLPGGAGSPANAVAMR
jgi:kynurenine formamidase